MKLVPFTRELFEKYPGAKLSHFNHGAVLRAEYWGENLVIQTNYGLLTYLPRSAASPKEYLRIELPTKTIRMRPWFHRAMEASGVRQLDLDDERPFNDPNYVWLGPVQEYEVEE